MEHGGRRVRYEQDAVAEMHRVSMVVAGLQDALDEADEHGQSMPVVVPIDRHSEAG